MVEKARDVKAKVNLQPLSKTREIDIKYLKAHRTLVKKDKNNTNWEHRDWNKDKDKAKSYNLFSANS